MKIKGLPRSKAKTAYGLVMDARRAIADEPKRANMSTYVDERSPENGGPACGTVGCFAGWIILAANRVDPVNETVYDATVAHRLIGEEVDYYTVSRGHHVFNSGAGDACAQTEPGTRPHAKAVLARIDKFVAVNKAKLRARKLIRKGGKLYGEDEVTPRQ